MSEKKETGAREKVFSSFVWAFLERCGAQGVGIIVNIVLARLLTPDDYGILAIMVIFTSLANQLVQNGFNTSLIQNRDVTEEDYSSVLHVSMLLTVVMYGVLFFCAPVIADFYETPGLVEPLRVLALVLFPVTLQSVQTAKLRREMDFKQLFTLTILSSLIGGASGVVMALCGFGVWALVAQQLCGAVGACIVLQWKLKWRPHAVINWHRIRILFSYGWKLLLAAAVNTLYNDLSGLIIGKKYTPTMLAYYDKGNMLPSKLISSINDAIQNVMLSALAREQDDRERCKMMMRRSVQVSCFLIFPMMAGLAAVAEPVTIILLTEKWLPSVPFLQLSCLIYALIPIAVANLQAIKAMGRSDIFLKLEIIKKIIGLLALVIAVVYFDTALAIMWASALTLPLSLFVNAYPNKKLVGYSFVEQFRDIFPPLLLSIAMFFGVSAIGLLDLSVWVMLLVQVPVGVVIYVVGAVVFRLESFSYALGIIKGYLTKFAR